MTTKNHTTRTMTRKVNGVVLTRTSPDTWVTPDGSFKFVDCHDGFWAMVPADGSFDFKLVCSLRSGVAEAASLR